jgi:hypothetical protein
LYFGGSGCLYFGGSGCLYFGGSGCLYFGGSGCLYFGGSGCLYLGGSGALYLRDNFNAYKDAVAEQEDPFVLRLALNQSRKDFSQVVQQLNEFNVISFRNLHFGRHKKEAEKNLKKKHAFSYPDLIIVKK